MSEIGDVDGDGVNDYVVGAFYSRQNNRNLAGSGAPGVSVNGKGFAGRVYVYSGATGEVHSTFDGDGAGVWLGEELESNTGAERRFFISTWNADGNAGRIYVHRWK